MMMTTQQRRHAARKAWEADLVRLLEPDALARLRATLAQDERLVERATDAELRQHGTGALAAMIGITAKTKPRTHER